MRRQKYQKDMTLKARRTRKCKKIQKLVMILMKSSNRSHDVRLTKTATKRKEKNIALSTIKKQSVIIKKGIK